MFAVRRDVKFSVLSLKYYHIPLQLLPYLVGSGLRNVWERCCVIFSFVFYRSDGGHVEYFVLLLMSSVGIICAENCLFPSAVYDKDNLGWVIYPKEDVTELDFLNRRVFFNGHEMSLLYNLGDYARKTQVIYKYECLQEKKSGKNKYLVKKVVKDDKDTFGCIQFLIRNINVVQLRVGPFSESQTSVKCNDRVLELWDAPMVYYHNTFWTTTRGLQTQYQQCPLEGGYVVDWYNNSGHLQCQNVIPPLKFENECIIGEGMLFHPTIKNELDCKRPYSRKHYEIAAKMRCFAYWTEGPYTFMVLLDKHGLGHENPCARFRTQHEDIFELDYFIDGLCLSTDIDPHSKSDKYIKLKLTKSPAVGLCSDDTEACSLLNCDDAEFYEVEGCRHSCGLCIDNNPYKSYTKVAFPDQFQGKWLRQVFYRDDETWQFSGSTLIIPSYGEFVNLGSTQCEEDGFYSTYSLVATFDNGCSPRAVTLSMSSLSSSVLRYKISTTIIPNWGLDYEPEKYPGKLHILSDNAAWWCVRDKHKMNDPPLYDAYTKSAIGSFNLVKINMPQPSVNCKVDFTNSHFLFKLSTGDICSGLVRKSGDKLIFKFSKCDPPENIPQRNLFYDDRVNVSKLSYQKSYEVECLADFTGAYSRHFFITKSHDFGEILGRDYSCWIFSVRPVGSIYWFPQSMCDSYTDIHINHAYNFKIPMVNMTVEITTNLSYQVECSRCSLYIFTFFKSLLCNIIL